MTYATPFNYDAWKLAAPEDREGGATCGDCLFCKGIGRMSACVVEVFDAEDEDELYDAEIRTVKPTQEACDQWADSED